MDILKNRVNFQRVSVGQNCVERGAFKVGFGISKECFRRTELCGKSSGSSSWHPPLLPGFRRTELCGKSTDHNDIFSPGDVSVGQNCVESPNGSEGNSGSHHLVSVGQNCVESRPPQPELCSVT